MLQYLQPMLFPQCDKPSSTHIQNNRPKYISISMFIFLDIKWEPNHKFLTCSFIHCNKNQKKIMRKPSTRTAKYQLPEKVMMVITMQSLAETIPAVDETESVEAACSCSQFRN
jgi:hypothetical protein